MIGLIFLYSALVIISLILTYWKFKKVIQANTIFTVLWCIVGILSLCYHLPIREPSAQIHKYIAISVISFNSIFLMFCKKNVRPTKEQNIFNFTINYKLLYIINVIALILISPYILSAIKIILQSGFANVRTEVYVSVTEGSSVVAILTRTLPSAIFTAISLIAATELAQNKYKLLPFALTDIFIYTFTFGGRFSVLNFIVFYVASYIILKKHKKVKIKKIYVFVGIIALITVTALRDSNGMSVLDMGVLYFVGSLSYLETILNRSELYGLTSPPMYGYLTTGFIMEPIVLALKLFLRLDIDVPSYFFNTYAQQWTNIGTFGNAIWYNNNTTMFYTFLLDFGEIGIVIGTIFIAIVVCVAQNSYTKYHSLRSLYILVYMFGVIMISTIMYSLTSLSASIIIIILMIAVKKQNVKIN